MRLSILLLIFLVSSSTVPIGAAEWQISTVNPITKGGWETSLALDPSGNPGIIYSTQNDVPTGNYWGQAASAWEWFGAIDSFGRHPSLAYDSAGTPHLCYDYSSGEIKYAKRAGNAWQYSIVDAGSRPSLALSSSGNPSVSYSSGYALKYAKWTGSAWQKDTIDDTGYNYLHSSSLALDSSGNPHISYVDVGPSDLKYARWTGSVWEKIVVDHDAHVGQSSLALDTYGNPHIGYTNYTSGAIKHAWYDGSSWKNETVDYTGVLGQYTYPSIDLDGSGKPHISYYDTVAKDLKYAKYFSVGSISGWIKETVDEGGEVGQYTSLEIDAADNPHISYYDSLNDALKYARASSSNPVPVLTGIKPISAVAGSQGFSLTVEGTNFVQGSVVRWNGADRPTHLNTACAGGTCVEWLTADIYTSDISTKGTASVTVFNPAPGGGVSNSISFQVRNLPAECGIGVFRPSALKNWILDRPVDGTVDVRDHFGSATDIPLIGNFNNDGTADRAQYRSGDWIVDYGIDGSVNQRNQYGLPGDIPLAGRMNTDTAIDRGVFRAGEWIFDFDWDGDTDRRDMYGMKGDVPLVGDFNNDGFPDRAVFRSRAYDNWILDYNMDGSIDIRNHFGSATDIPVICDFNKDGKADRAVFRNGEWIIDHNMDGSINSRLNFGQAGDKPLAWNL